MEKQEKAPTLVKTYSIAVMGLEAIPITVEVSVSRGIKYFLVGLPDNAVKESHERIMAAFRYSGLKIPHRQVVVNMAPADVKKEGSSYDLPIALALVASEDDHIRQETLDRYMLVGELSLDGTLQPIKGALPMAIKARAMGLDGLILPEASAREAAMVDRLKVYGAKNLRQVVDFFQGRIQLEPIVVDTRKEFYDHQFSFDFNFDEVKGQENVKRALEVAAAGGHNLIMVGPPGSGKSMMAKRLPSILPPLSLAESLETTQIHSVAGKMGDHTGLIAVRPFRSPHHTISQVALCGGGTNPQPGEISLAHNGVLFCDELPEFNRTVLEVLRQPLEDRHISVSRAKYSIDYPCSFMFVASMNPCPCGYYNHPTKPCSCSPSQVQRYLNRISGPLLDRIDIQVEITPVPFEEMSKQQKGESSDSIRKRVIAARERQRVRYEGIRGVHCNAQMNSALLEQYAQPTAEGFQMLRMAMTRLDLSARAYDRILRVSRTIADLDGSETIQSHHIAEAISYRTLDRNSWGERSL